MTVLSGPLVVKYQQEGDVFGRLGPPTPSIKPGAPASPPCAKEDNIIYTGGDLQPYINNGQAAVSADACCSRCRQTPTCTHWSWEKKSSRDSPLACWL